LAVFVGRFADDATGGFLISEIAAGLLGGRTEYLPPLGPPVAANDHEAVARQLQRRLGRERPDVPCRAVANNEFGSHRNGGASRKKSGRCSASVLNDRGAL